MPGPFDESHYFAVAEPATLSLCAGAAPPASNPLVIVDHGKSDALIVLSPEAGRFERQAAEDLAKYIKVMAGASIPISSTGNVWTGPSRVDVRYSLSVKRHLPPAR